SHLAAFALCPRFFLALPLPLRLLSHGAYHQRRPSLLCFQALTESRSSLLPDSDFPCHPRPSNRSVMQNFLGSSDFHLLHFPSGRDVCFVHLAAAFSSRVGVPFASGSIFVGASFSHLSLEKPREQALL